MTTTDLERQAPPGLLATQSFVGPTPAADSYGPYGVGVYSVDFPLGTPPPQTTLTTATLALLAPTLLALEAEYNSYSLGLPFALPPIVFGPPPLDGSQRISGSCFGRRRTE